MKKPNEAAQQRRPCRPWPIELATHTPPSVAHLAATLQSSAANWLSFHLLLGPILLLGEPSGPPSAPPHQYPSLGQSFRRVTLSDGKEKVCADDLPLDGPINEEDTTDDHGQMRSGRDSGPQ